MKARWRRRAWRRPGWKLCLARVRLDSMRNARSSRMRIPARCRAGRFLAGARAAFGSLPTRGGLQRGSRASGTSFWLVGLASRDKLAPAEGRAKAGTTWESGEVSAGREPAQGSKTAPLGRRRNEHKAVHYGDGGWAGTYGFGAGLKPSPTKHSVFR